VDSAPRGVIRAEVDKAASAKADRTAPLFFARRVVVGLRPNAAARRTMDACRPASAGGR